MDRERQRAIASSGGKAAHALGVAHEFSSAEASAAGAIGGRSVSANREHMREIGRRGGIARGESRRAAKMADESRMSAAPEDLSADLDEGGACS